MNEHTHIPLKSVPGHATFSGKNTVPNKETIDMVERLAKTAYELHNNCPIICKHYL